MHVDPYAAKFGLSEMVDPKELRKRKQQLEKELKKKGHQDKLKRRRKKLTKNLSMHVGNAEELMNRSDLKNYEEPIVVKNVTSGGTSSVGQLRIRLLLPTNTDIFCLSFLVCFTSVDDETLFLNSTGHPAAFNDNFGVAKIFPDSGVNMGQIVIRPLAKITGKTHKGSFLVSSAVNRRFFFTYSSLNMI